MIIFLTAAAAAMSVSGGSAAVRVNLSDLNSATVRPAIQAAATQACRALREPVEASSFCVQDAVRRGMADYRQMARKRTTLVVADRR